MEGNGGGGGGAGTEGVCARLFPSCAICDNTGEPFAYKLYASTRRTHANKRTLQDQRRYCHMAPKAVHSPFGLWRRLRDPALIGHHPALDGADPALIGRNLSPVVHATNVVSRVFRETLNSKGGEKKTNLWVSKGNLQIDTAKDESE